MASFTILLKPDRDITGNNKAIFFIDAKVLNDKSKLIKDIFK